MTDADPDFQPAPRTDTVGDRLRAAREALGLSLAEVAARTRIPLRHLENIETGHYDGLPSRTYAVGFVRAYARAVDADEVALARDARDEVARTMRPQPQYQPYETADPAKVPSRGVVIVTAGVALAVLVLAILWFATGLFGNRASDAPAATTPPVAVAAPAAAPAAPAAVPTGGQVTLTASDEVWLRVYDAAGTTLFQGTMKPGDRYDVPASANGPELTVGRPDKLQVSLNGSAVPALGDGSRPIRGVSLAPAAIAARLAGGSAPAATPSPAAVPAAAPTAAATPRARPTLRATRPAATPSPDAPENLLPRGFDNSAG